MGSALAAPGPLVCWVTCGSTASVQRGVPTMAKHASTSARTTPAKRQRQAEADVHATRNRKVRAGQVAASPDPVIVKLLALPPPDAAATPSESHGGSIRPSKRRKCVSMGTGQQRHPDSIERLKPRSLRAPPAVPGLDLCPVNLPRAPIETSSSDRRYAYPPVVAAAASIGQAGWTQVFCAGELSRNNGR